MDQQTDPTPSYRTHGSELARAGNERVILVRYEDVIDSPLQYRTSLGDLSELQASIKEHGVIEPIVVRIVKGDVVECVAGHRRKAAAPLAGVLEGLAIVRELSDEEVIELQVVENSQRTSPHPIDEAMGFDALLKRGRTVGMIADKIGRPAAYVVQRLKLCGLSKACRKALDEELILLGVALELAKLPSQKLQEEALKMVARHPSYGPRNDGLTTVHDARKLIETDVMRALKNAPFDTTDATLTKAGACSACPKRTGNQVELFPDASSPDLCTDATCFRSKLDAHWAKVKATAKTEGKDVMPEAKAKESFSEYGGLRSVDFHDLNGEVWSPTGRHVKVRSLFKKGELPEVTVARNPHTGDVVELVSRRTVDAALRKREKATGSDDGGTGGRAATKLTPQQQAANKLALMKDLAGEKAREVALVTLAEQAELMTLEAYCSKFVTPLLHALLDPLYQGVEKAAKRRASPEDAPKKLKRAYGSSVEDLEKLIDKVTPAARRALLIEIVAGEYFDGPEFEDFCKAAGINLKGLEVNALAELKAEQKAKEKPAARKGAKKR